MFSTHHFNRFASDRCVSRCVCFFSCCWFGSVWAWYGEVCTNSGATHDDHTTITASFLNVSGMSCVIKELRVANREEQDGSKLNRLSPWPYYLDCVWTNSLGSAQIQPFIHPIHLVTVPVIICYEWGAWRRARFGSCFYLSPFAVKRRTFSHATN